MKVTLIVLGSLLALLVLFLLLRLGVLIEYSAQGVLVRVWTGPVRLTLIPKRQKTKTEKKKKDKKKRKDKKKPDISKAHKRGGSLRTLLDLLPMLLEALGNLCRRIRVDHLHVHYSIAGQPDPSAAALLWGRLQIGGGVVCQLLETKIQVRERDVRIETDFFTEEMTVYLSASCSLRVGEILAVALRLLWQYLIWNRQRKRTAQEGR